MADVDVYLIILAAVLLAMSVILCVLLARDSRKNKVIEDQYKELLNKTVFLSEYELMKYTLTSDALGIALWDMDVVVNDPSSDRNKIVWSREFRRMLGFEDENDFPNTAAFLIGRIHPKERGKVIKAFADHFSDRTGSTPYDLEYRILTKGGEYRYFRALGATQRAPDGTPLRVAGALEDITEDKRMREEIEARDLMLRTVNNTAGILLSSETGVFEDGLYLCMSLLAEAADSDRVHIWKNHTENGKLFCTQLYEWSGDAEPRQGGQYAVSVPYDDHFPRWRKTLSRGGCVNSLVKDRPPEEQSYLTPQGILSVLIAPVFIDEKFWGFVGFDDCRHERLYSENEEITLRSASLLIANALIRDEMNRSILDANNAKSRFLANMSHEIRTPISAIVGMTSIGKAASDPKRKDYCLKRIEEASDHLLGVINDVLDISKIEAGKFELSHVDFNFDVMLRRVVNVVRFRVDEKEQTLASHVDKDIPKILVGDDQRLAQVITNLVGNAVKFTPVKGKITIDSKLLGEEDGVCTVQISVTDSGIGISPEQQAKLFKPFRQADSGTSRKFGGTGLGLAISGNIIEMMGGKVWIESELGQGAAFIFTVQLKRSDRKKLRRHDEIEDGADTDVEGIFDGRRILLAEDVEINREIVTALLETTGVEIDCAVNGFEAVRMFADSPGAYDLIFMDVQMPEMDGYGATRLIRALKTPKALNVPIIAMTANVFREDIEQCMECGMNGHIGKPLNMDELMSKMRAHLR